MAAAGKVCTGFSKPYVALYNANGGVITFTNGQVLARGVNVDIAPEASTDNNFYADNQLAESASGVFTGGTVTLTVDGLKTAAERLIMGLPARGDDGFMAYDDTQSVPYVAIGFIARYMSEAVTTYVPYILVKTKFDEIGTSAATQENEIDWQTTELTSNIMRADDTNHSWKLVGLDYETEALAEAALKNKLGITETEVFGITQNLVNVTSDYSGTQVTEGSSLEITLTAADTMTIGTVLVLMDGEDVTATAWNSETSKVTIASVSGAIVINAVAS